MKRNIFLFFLFAFCSFLYAQHDAEKPLNSFAKAVTAFSFLNPQEKVYLHFDNTGYYAGETIWFKAYVVTAVNGYRSDLSKVLYVELVSPDGSIEATEKIRLENGEGNGSIVLKKYLPTAYYEVRAYTRYMLNFGKDMVFSRTFPIYAESEVEGYYPVHPIESSKYDLLTQREKLPDRKDVNMDFYPEGGSMIAGMRSRIAFKATGKKGENIDVKGTVYNRSGEPVAHFSTLHQGMGIFELTPESGKYKVKAGYKGKEYTFNLPDPLPTGYVLNVNNQDADQMLIQLQKSRLHPLDSIGITVSSRGVVFAFESLYPGEDPYILRLPKEKLPPGSIQVTVFDKQGNVYAERLAFNNRQEYIPVQISREKEKYAPFENINLNMSVQDKHGNPVQTTFSLSVRDAETEIPSGCQDNIMTGLLLSSELKGFVENPGYYFGKDDKYRRQMLDLLMMVQGWRRYDWQQMAGIAPFEPEHPIEKGILVNGTILSVFGKKTRENIEVTNLLTNKKKGFQVANCITDSLGDFNFLLDVEGTWDMTLQTKEGKKNKDYRVLIHRNFSPEPKFYSYYETLFKERPKPDIQYQDRLKETEIAPLTEEEKREIDERPDSIKGYWLEEVTIKKKVDKREDEMYKNPSAVYDVKKEVDKIRDEGDFEEVSIDRFLMNLNPFFAYRRLGEKSSRIFCYKMQRAVYPNIPVDRIESISIVENVLVPKPPNKWEYITQVYVYKNKNREKRRENKGIRPTRLKGYSVPVRFYSPDYGAGIPPDRQDHRRTLYWNPDVKTDNEGKATVAFYNNSSCKQLTVSAEGLTAEGTPILNTGD